MRIPDDQDIQSNPAGVDFCKCSLVLEGFWVLSEMFPEFFCLVVLNLVFRDDEDRVSGHFFDISDWYLCSKHHVLLLWELAD